jgi:hypothetical protein
VSLIAEVPSESGRPPGPAIVGINSYPRREAVKAPESGNLW